MIYILNISELFEIIKNAVYHVLIYDDNSTWNIISNICVIKFLISINKRQFRKRDKNFSSIF